MAKNSDAIEDWIQLQFKRWLERRGLKASREQVSAFAAKAQRHMDDIPELGAEEDDVVQLLSWTYRHTDSP